MSRFALFALAPLLAGLLATPAAASPEEPHRLSIQALGGLNFVLPTYEFQLGYRLPFYDNRLEPFISYAPHSPSLSKATFSIAQVGCRAYVTPTGPLQPFGVVSMGVTDNTYAGLGPTVMGGVGVDWNFAPMVGLTASVTLGVPTLVRPMVGLRVAF